MEAVIAEAAARCQADLGLVMWTRRHPGRTTTPPGWRWIPISWPPWNWWSSPKSWPELRCARGRGRFTGMITCAVEQALEQHGGDITAATEGLGKVISNAMTIFNETRVGGNYKHTIYPEMLEIPRNKIHESIDKIWEAATTGTTPRC